MQHAPIAAGVCVGGAPQRRPSASAADAWELAMVLSLRRRVGVHACHEPPVLALCTWRPAPDSHNRDVLLPAARA